MGFKIDSYPAGDAAKNTQAYRDGLGYYTLMQAIAECENDTKGMSNDEYKSTMASAVSNTGALLKADEATRNAMSGGCVGISVKKNSNGSLDIEVNPAELYMGELTSGLSVTVTVSQRGYEIYGSPDKELTLKVGESAQIVYVNDGSIVLDDGEKLEDLFSLVSSNTSCVKVAGTTITALSNSNGLVEISDGEYLVIKVNVIG